MLIMHSSAWEFGETKFTCILKWHCLENKGNLRINDLVPENLDIKLENLQTETDCGK